MVWLLVVVVVVVAVVVVAVGVVVGGGVGGLLLGLLFRGLLLRLFSVFHRYICKRIWLKVLVIKYLKDYVEIGKTTDIKISRTALFLLRMPTGLRFYVSIHFCFELIHLIFQHGRVRGEKNYLFHNSH